MRAIEYVRQRWPAIAGLIVLLVAWEVAVRLAEVPEFLVPSPSAVWRKLLKEWALIAKHTRATLLNIAAGYVIAVCAGLGLALLVSRYRWIDLVLFPYLVGSQTIPKIAIAPLLMIWLGTGWLPKVVMVATIAFFPICINTITGFRSVDPGYLQLCRSVAASERDVFLKVRFPYAVPYIFAGLKVATTLSVLGAIASEWVGASEGLGYMILASNSSLETSRVFAGLLMLILIGVIFFSLVGWLERRVSWREPEEMPVTQAEV